MKLKMFVLFSVFGSFYADSSDLDILKKDLLEFEPLLPKTSIALLFMTHLLFDKDFRRARNFIGSSGSIGHAMRILRTDSFKDLADELKGNGIDILDIIKALMEKPIFPLSLENFEEAEIDIQLFTTNEFIDEVIAALPREKIAKLMQHKINTSPTFMKYFNAAKNPSVNNRIEAILSDSKLKKTFETFMLNDIDVRYIYSRLKFIISWAAPSIF
uniref:Venom polypeptide n=1 Tax=Dolopus genitalis TaxID=2488630 RepID=A0A3G5BIK8_DOLGE|nr:venom polypeptide [Dolopus genitalis]